MLRSMVFYFRGRSRPSMARYVKTSMFLQSPEIEHHTPNHYYVIFPHWERKEPELEPEQRKAGVILCIPTLTYLLLWLLLWLWLLIHPPKVRINTAGECAEKWLASLGIMKTWMFSYSVPWMALSVPNDANHFSVQSFSTVLIRTHTPSFDLCPLWLYFRL